MQIRHIEQRGKEAKNRNKEKSETDLSFFTFVWVGENQPH